VASANPIALQAGYRNTHSRKNAATENYRSSSDARFSKHSPFDTSPSNRNHSSSSVTVRFIAEVQVEEIGGSDSMAASGNRAGPVSALEERLHCLLLVEADLQIAFPCHRQWRFPLHNSLQGKNITNA
jgi:hypothetical protein